MNSETNDFKRICSLAELSENYGKRFLTDDPEDGQLIDIAVYKYKDNVYAMSNICPHQQSALIYDGYIEDNCVVCPVHGWRFDIDTGRTPSGGSKLQIYEAKIIDNDVYIKVKSKKYNW
ncbi:MAG: Rieske 2Fe-2S domain-containing protein [Ignavibacteriaceae bacterium]